MGAAEAASAGQAALEVVDEARANLQRVFLGFLIGLVGTVWGLRAFVWDFLKETTKARMDETVAAELDIIVRTPFDVILLQVKIGIIVGALIALPLIVYYGRNALIRRELVPDLPLTKTKRYALLTIALLLGLGGVVYAYAFFFPFMFEFLAVNALLSEIAPQYDIVMWTEFLILLTISFGLAAQIPLFMTVASYTETVPYEFFRDRWKYAIVGIFLFGALFSPPDPFTQLMWGMPLVGLYLFSLALAKLAANLNRAGSAADPAVRRAVRRKAYVAAGIGAGGVVLGTLAARYDLLRSASDAIGPYLPGPIRPTEPWSIGPYLASEGLLGEALFGVGIGVVAIALVVTAYAIQVLRRPIAPSRSALAMGDPSELELRPLDVEGLRTAPIEAFAAMEEDEAVAIAREALDEGETERAELVLERFDAAQEYDADGTEPEDAGEDSGDRMMGAATTFVDGFTEGETTEEDIGGYWYDLVFIYESLTSRMFRVLVVFLGVMFGVFYWLYSGGIGQLRRDFLSRLPPEVVDPNDISLIVALHPVEVLLFNVKISLVVGVIVVLPLLLYYAWPALEERGFVSGDRRVFFLWGSLLIGGLVVGSFLGYSYIAPPIISGLVFHSIDAGMVISYRLSSFAWLIVFTTVGIGLLFNLVMSMILFHLAGIVRYDAMRQRWRGVVVWSLIGAALFTPGSVLTMLIVGVPIILTYGLGLVLLWVLTVPVRIGRRGETLGA